MTKLGLRDAWHHRWTMTEAWRVGMGLIAIGALSLLPKRDRLETARNVQQYFKDGVVL